MSRDNENTYERSLRVGLAQQKRDFVSKYVANAVVARGPDQLDAGVLLVAEAERAWNEIVARTKDADG